MALLLDEALRLLAQAEASKAVTRITKAMDLLEQFEVPQRPVPYQMADLSPRERETLQRLLAGDSEKQAASNLRLSVNTVHDYVKALHRRFEVSSRAELLAKFIQPPLM